MGDADTVGRNADVTIVWTGNNPYRGWENEFWNRSIKRAYDLGPDTLIAGATAIAAPVMKFDAGAARKTAMPAKSLGSPQRWTGVRARTFS